MPIYEYSCTKCGATTEAMQKISDPPLKECPKCGGALAKMISNSSFILKGSGWYATDYAKKSNGSGNGKRADHKDRLKEIESKKETPTVDSGSDTKADKPAEKAAKAAKAGSED